MCIVIIEHLSGLATSTAIVSNHARLHAVNKRSNLLLHRLFKDRIWGINSSQSGKWRKIQFSCHSPLQSIYFGIYTFTISFSCTVTAAFKRFSALVALFFKEVHLLTVVKCSIKDVAVSRDDHVCNLARTYNQTFLLLLFYVNCTDILLNIFNIWAAQIWWVLPA